MYGNTIQLSSQPPQLSDVQKTKLRQAELPFAVDVNRLFTDKVKPGDPRFWRLNMTFRTERLTAAELRAAIHAGHAWTAPHRKVQHKKPDGKKTTYRVKQNVIGVQAIGLDLSLIHISEPTRPY